MTTEAATKVATVITDAPAGVFNRNWDSSSAGTLGSMVSMTGYWDAYKLDIPMQWLMAMATVMAIVSSERNQIQT
jgi:hypothetical protein